MERLDKFLCDCGVGTRSEVKAILKSGRVTVDGKSTKDNGLKIDPNTQVICLDGQTLTQMGTVVLMLHKPAGYVTATEDAREQTVMELLPQAMAKAMARGRATTPTVRPAVKSARKVFLSYDFSDLMRLGACISDIELRRNYTPAY